MSAKRWYASPLLVDENVPDEVVRSVVDVRPGPGEDLLGVLVELNLAARWVLGETRERFLQRYQSVVDTHSARPDPQPVASGYVRCLLTRSEVRQLLHADESDDPATARAERTIFRIWPDYVLRAQVDHSISTIKADAAHRTYGGQRRRGRVGRARHRHRRRPPAFRGRYRHRPVGA